MFSRFARLPIPAVSFLLVRLCVSAIYLVVPAFSVFSAVSVVAADSPQWGSGYTHNNASSEKNMPESFSIGRRDPNTNRIVDSSPEIRWAVPLGRNNYAPPTVASGKVLIGTDDCAAYDSVLEGDRGVLLCFDEKTGEFLWKLALPKYTKKACYDYAATGMTSPPTVLGDRIYMISNRGEVLCLDLNGMKDGNQGPFIEEGQFMTGPDQAEYVPTEKDADIIWCLNMEDELGIRQHDAGNASIMVHDGLLYINTTNGLNAEYTSVENPDAPSLLVVDAQTGRPVARDDFWVRGDVVHGQWSSPSIGTVGENTYVFFGGGNGVYYAFEALNREKVLADLDESGNGKKLHNIQAQWTYNGQPIEEDGTRRPFKIGRGSTSWTCQPPPVFADNKVYMIFGIAGWIGKQPRKSQLVCVDLTQDLSGEVSETAKVWTLDMDGGLLSAPTVVDGLAYFADRKGKFYSVDATTGEVYGTVRLKGDFWAAPLVADGKAYIGAERKTLYVIKTGKEPEIIAEVALPEPTYASMVAANSTLFVPTSGFLFAVEKKDTPRP
ncbi:MAG: PQQ-binding-like beta-propeller repeat protein [Thermoguttaceae bacterium]